MYERTVTAAFVSKFPDEAARFWNFGVISYRRLLNNAKTLYGEKFKEMVPVTVVEKAEKMYEEVRHDFEDAICARCETFRIGFSWSKLDLPSMAKKAGYGLEHCYWHAFSIPTQHAHSTSMAIKSRLEQSPDGVFFERASEHTHAAVAVCVAHVVLLKMLRVQNTFFSLGLDEELLHHEAECKAMWPGIEKDVARDM